jgi:hypothetical protein
MGIDLLCKEKYFSCGYSFWNVIRTATIIATADYLKDQLVKSNLEEETYPYVSLNNINCFMDELLSYNKNTEKSEETTEEDVVSAPVPTENDEEIPIIGLFLSNCESSMQIQDLLIYFGVGGVYALCNKMDCEGYYSVGNAYDILELFKLIKPFIINKTDLETPKNVIYNCFIEVEKVFQESVDKKEIVIIT